MKKIIVKGERALRKDVRKCPYCGCQFQYTNDEAYKVEGFNGCVKICVKCPWCLEEIRLDTINSQISPILEDTKRMFNKYSPDCYETRLDMTRFINEDRSW